MNIKYIEEINHNYFTIIFDGKYIECRNLVDGEFKYKKLLNDNPESKIALVYRKLIYKANYRPAGFFD